MQFPKYNYTTDAASETFEFISEGPNGSITKMVQYTETNLENVFNLAFGDYNEMTGKINDAIVTNNNDSKKVLATVASTVYAFTGKKPAAIVYASGSNDARTRLYRIGITNNLEEIVKDFDVFGFRNDNWEKFMTGVEYEAFVVKRKKM